VHEIIAYYALGITVYFTFTYKLQRLSVWPTFKECARCFSTVNEWLCRLWNARRKANDWVVVLLRQLDCYGVDYRRNTNT